MAATANADSTRVKGFSDSRSMFRYDFGEFEWMVGNLNKEQRIDLHPILAYTRRCLDLMRLRSSDKHPHPEWVSFRDEVRRATSHESNDAQLFALIDVCERNNIPKQYLFDVLDGVDMWIRFGRFETFQELSQFACQIGGATLCAAIHVVGYDKPGFESAACASGGAVCLTQILARCGHDLTEERYFLPQDLLSQYECDLEEPKAGTNRKPFSAVVRSLANQIELEFFEGSSLMDFLSIDGQRMVKSLFAAHWHLLNKIKQDPHVLLYDPVTLSKVELFKLRMKHILGTEGGVPILSGGGHH